MGSTPGFPATAVGCPFQRPSSRAHQRCISGVCVRPCRNAFLHIITQDGVGGEASRPKFMGGVGRRVFGGCVQQRHVVLQSCPFRLKLRFRHISRTVLGARSNAVQAHDRTRAWDFVWPHPESAFASPSRFDDFVEGRLDVLLREMMVNAQESPSHRSSPRAEAACQRVRMSNKRVWPQAPRRLSTRCRTSAQEVVRQLPEEVLNCTLESPVKLDSQKFFESLKSVPRGPSLGPGGCTNEHSRILVDDVVTTELLFEACTSLPQASLPREISVALMSVLLTALAKPDGGVRGIATGCTLRRLVA